jgi:NAD(P)-dependent dehydrogenase (short-subunit alcohol dehydrogenase family)
MLLSNRVAIVSGGAGGIGRGIVLKLAEEGCAVAIPDINIKEANDIISEVLKKGVKGLAIQCDVTNNQQVKNTVAQVVNQLGTVDILVNCAGGFTDTPPIEDIEEGLWDKVIALNLKSDYLFCKYVVPYMKEKRYGKIINFSSMGAVVPPGDSCPYNTAKAGVIGLTLDLAFALASFNINVNTILPGPVQTHIFDGILSAMNDKEKEIFFHNLGKVIPLQRIGSAEDMANAVVFLASELSSYITGVALPVAGGLPLPVGNSALPK